MVTCIGLASGIGAGNSGCGQGPIFLKENLNLDKLEWYKMIVNDQGAENKYDHLAKLNNELSEASYYLSQKEAFFLSFGGDHSSAIGTWTGISEDKKSKNQEIGLLWIDAHMDSHTPETSDSGNIHGMPLASLLGFGDKRLTHILSENPKLKPENVILIGIRSFEPGEQKLLENLNVKIYFIEEVLERGFETVVKEAIDSIQKRTPYYGVSFDLDVIDPNFIDAVGTPVPNGIHPDDALKALDIFIQNPPIAFEIVEYNPKLDKKLSTLNFTRELIKKLAVIND